MFTPIFIKPQKKSPYAIARGMIQLLSLVFSKASQMPNFAATFSFSH